MPITLNGDDFDNILTGGAGNDTLNGLGGSDQLSGLAGDDTLSGGNGDDILDGGKGADALDGGIGNDTYVIDNAKDLITDSAGTADKIIASISVDLAANFGGAIEHATLTGTAALNAFGNVAANILTGNDGANILDGRGGNDTMAGGKGNDTYFVDSQNDKVIEDANGGIDTVNVKSSFFLDFGVNAGQQIENINVIAGSGIVTIGANDLNNIVNGAEAKEFIDGNGGNDTLNGGGGDDVLSGGFGNDFSRFDGNDILNGGDGNDFLQGGTGNDIMTGGAGNDTYFVDSIGDKVIETIADSAVGGIDEVQSFIDFSIAALGNVENILLLNSVTDAADPIRATGNALNNRLDGNFADNLLDGGKGIDTSSAIRVTTPMSSTISPKAMRPISRRAQTRAPTRR